MEGGLITSIPHPVAVAVATLSAEVAKLFFASRARTRTGFACPVPPGLQDMADWAGLGLAPIPRLAFHPPGYRILLT